MKMTLAEAECIGSYLFEQMKAANMSNLAKATQGPTSTGAPAVDNPTPRAGRSGLGGGAKPEATPAPAAAGKTSLANMLHNAAGGTGGATQAKGMTQDSARAGALPKTNSRPAVVPQGKPGGVVLAALIAATVPAAVKLNQAVKTIKPPILKSTKERT